MSTDHLTDLTCPVCNLLEVTLVPGTSEFLCTYCGFAGLASKLKPHRVYAIRTTQGALSRLTSRRRMLRERKGQDPAPQLIPLTP